MPSIFLADRIFTGEYWLSDYAIVTNEGRITELLPFSSLPDTDRIEKFKGCIIAPAFIDLQLYGAKKKLFSAYPEPETLQLIQEHNEKGGTAFCLPTIATNTNEIIFRAIDVVNSFWKKGGEGILGLHLEGPWINPAKRGAHLSDLIREPDYIEVKEILDYGKGVIKMITLAPEFCSDEIIRLMLSHNIVISAGHSNATFQQAKESFAKGISAVTHLYNAMSPLHHRAPGLTGAAMDDEKVMVSIIPDGIHTDFAALRIAKKIIQERLFVITDSVTETEKGAYHHHLTGDKYEAAGILSGSALTMIKALQHLVKDAGIDLDESLRMCGLYPAKVLRLDNELGKIEKGFISSMLVLNNSLDVVRVIR